MAGWFKGWFSGGRRKIAPRQTFRPRMEVLEDRLVLNGVTYWVTSTNDTGFGTLRAEVGLAGSNDTIKFDTHLQGQTITLASQIQLGNGVTGLTIDPGTVQVFIDGNSATRLFEVVGGNITINDLFLDHGEVAAANGGAILVDNGATLNLDNDSLSGNDAVGSNSAGGAIENQGTLNVVGSTFSTNQAGGNGGAIDSNSGGNGGLTVSTSDFTGNAAGTNGGAINTTDTTTLNDDSFGGDGTARNTAGWKGGAVDAEGVDPGSTKLTVTESTFTNNRASNGTQGVGGAIFTTDVADVETTTFNSNSALNRGGALYYYINNNSDPATPYSSSLEVNQDYFLGNMSGSGGGIYSYVDVNSGRITVSVTNSTFYSNLATDGTLGVGGGISISHTTRSGGGGVSGTASATLINDTFFQNIAATHGGGLGVALVNLGTGTNTAELTSLTVYQNKAATDSAGLYVDAAADQPVVSVDNNIFDGNTVTTVGYNGPVDVTLTTGTTLNDIGYNLVGLSDNQFNPMNQDILNNNTGLANALAANGAKPGYPQTLALAANSPGYETGDQNLVTKPNPWSIDARGMNRQSNGTLKVSRGAEDPDATP